MHIHRACVLDSVLACGSGNGAVMMIDKESGKVC